MTHYDFERMSLSEIKDDIGWKEFGSDENAIYISTVIMSLCTKIDQLEQRIKKLENRVSNP